MAARLWTKNDRAHVTGRDFYHIFQKEMRSLYSLALILTNDCSATERCFVASLDDCLNAHSIFKEWALSWSKRAVIKNAIRVIFPRVEKDGETGPARVRMKSMLADALLGLQHFQRFVTVMFSSGKLQRQGMRPPVELLHSRGRNSSQPGTSTTCPECRTKANGCRFSA